MAWLSLCEGGGGHVTCLSSSCVNVRLHTKDQLSNIPGSTSEVCVVGGGGGVEREFSLGKAKQ